MFLPRLSLLWRRVIPLAIVVPLCLPVLFSRGAPTTTGPADTHRAMLHQYCVMCHNQKLRTGGVALDQLNTVNVAPDAETWEKVLRKVSTSQMPPPGLPHPDAPARTEFATWLETSLDRSAADNPNPGRPAIHRLNRAEYGNAIRDLLALNFDAGSMLPADDSGYGFDNIGDVLSVSPVLLERYMATARKVARLAVGDTKVSPSIQQYSVPRGLVQTEQVSEDLPLGSRGGAAIHHYFP